MDTPSTHAGRVIAGVDGSVHSARVLRTAAVLAGALNLRLDVFTCWERSEIDLAAHIPTGVVAEGDPLEAEAARLVEDAVERVFGLERPRTLATFVRYGHPSQILVQESASACLLVVGRRGQGGFAGLRLGSVSSACIAHARCPVLVVNSDVRPRG
ncbi:nucleotide-binding universal stress UspA family protein [Arthrobacter stackebrandtii]|uniref:Nucleotide-binding universal stress UspA family protein n=1 Tax=Arthrobacter stackebrandtii TaxID=272161 RepID=A0ABS4Z1I0_9MICC|nr:universal stress protein [Arthrobacter stackebrandtii]MBP2414831.1 nucleotide-binding universal stress UspA family protein [Arthrobacter stackebrandtii]PYG99488.1 universal stress protein UspA [Arthrobacter stackebrandtii]